MTIVHFPRNSTANYDLVKECRRGERKEGTKGRWRGREETVTAFGAEQNIEGVPYYKSTILPLFAEKRTYSGTSI